MTQDGFCALYELAVRRYEKIRVKEVLRCLRDMRPSFHNISVWCGAGIPELKEGALTLLKLVREFVERMRGLVDGKGELNGSVIMEFEAICEYMDLQEVFLDEYQPISPSTPRQSIFGVIQG